MQTLLIIDAQNDYLANGKYPLWNMEATLANIKQQIKLFAQAEAKIIFIQHIASANAPFFWHTD